MCDDAGLMKRAVSLAWEGIGRNSPNPLVGCVIVKDGRIVGEGAHVFERVDHAETVALAEAGEAARGSTVYVTLEPCSHEGRTPPCTDALIRAGVSRVVYGMKDPDPRVNGSGHAALENAGISVEGGLLEEEIREQNKFFVTAKEKGRPFVLLKWAMTSDGKIATRTGESRWISSERSRNVVHHLRNIFDAVLVGHMTAIVDNPRLTCRVDLSDPIPTELFPRSPADVRNPRRIVIDAFGATAGQALAMLDEPGKTILAVAPESEWDDPKYRDSIDTRRIEIVECPLHGGHVDLSHLMSELVKRDIHSVMIEGGAGVNAAFLAAGLVDEVAFCVAPKLFGGTGAPGPVGGGGVEFVREAWTLERVRHFVVDDDCWTVGTVHCSPACLPSQ